MDGLLKMGANVTGTVVEVGSELLTSGPQALERSGGIVRGIVKTSNDTGPIIKKVSSADLTSIAYLIAANIAYKQ